MVKKYQHLYQQFSKIQKWISQEEFSKALDAALLGKFFAYVVVRLAHAFRDWSGRPVQKALSAALIERSGRAMKIQLSIIDESQPGEALKLGEECAQISEWLQPSLPEDRERRATNLKNRLKELGAPYSMIAPVDSFFETRGRPGTDRKATIRALEHRLLNPDAKWMDLVEQFCDCGRGSHNQYCRERLREKVRQLRRFLEEHNIEVEI